jgi:hypothetical protein
MPTINPNVVMNISQNKSENNGNAVGYLKSMGISVGPPPVYSSGFVNAGMNDVKR